MNNLITLTREDAHRILENKKIFVGNPDISEKIQIKLIEAGFKWAAGCTEVINKEKPFLFTGGYRISFSDYSDTFYSSPKEEISPMRILRYNIQYKASFNTFDRVLVRNSDKECWVAGIYSHSIGIFKHNVNSVYYKYCIPYEGNEELVNTTDSPNR